MSRLLVWAVCGSRVGHSFWRWSFIEPPRLMLAWAAAAGLAASVGFAAAGASVGLAAGAVVAAAAAAGAAGGGVGWAICCAGFGAAASVGLAAAGPSAGLAGADGACCPHAAKRPVPAAAM